LPTPATRRPAARSLGARASALIGPTFSYCVAACDFASVVVASILAGNLYQLITFGAMPPVESIVTVGLAVGALVVVLSVQREDYASSHFKSYPGHFGRTFTAWNLAFVCVLALGFATKTSETFSRGATAVFYASGFVAVLASRLALVRLASAAELAGIIAPRRIFLAGFENQLMAFLQRPDLAESGMDIVSASVLREDMASIHDDLALAAAKVRVLRPDDVFILVPWSRTEIIEFCVNAFMRTPSEVHLGPEPILDRFTEAEVAKLGPFASLNLTRRPPSSLHRFEKRALDVVLSLVALIALSPLFLFVAALIKFESPGPVLFMQKRYGFNQEPFRIYKFRTMTTLEDDAEVVAATRGDKRVTRVGAVLRRLSIDELPQLMNVLLGRMSLVGPRPHALAHDQLFQERIADYARRHNVKPGITGWAQVCGLRGEIADDAMMRQRVQHDLYYIDNWSVWFDLKIMALTVLSRKAHSNAY
jgi:Undecaprenyl-phosphate glucose phosphotransferase